MELSSLAAMALVTPSPRRDEENPQSLDPTPLPSNSDPWGVKQEKAGRALTCGTATSTCPCLQTCVCVRTAYFRPGWSWINSHTQGQGRILALLDRSPKQGSRCAVCPAGHRGQQEQGNVTIWFDPDPEFECGGSQEQGKGQPDPLPSQTD